MKLVGRASARRLSSTGGSNRCVPPPVKDPCGASSPPVCPPPKSQGICPDPAALGIMCADYVPCVPWGTHWARLSRRKNMELVFGVTCLVVAIIAVSNENFLPYVILQIYLC